MEAQGLISSSRFDGALEPSSSAPEQAGPARDGAPSIAASGDSTALALPQYHAVELSALRIPVGMLQQLNRYLLDNQLSFQFALGGASSSFRFSAQPGDSFVNDLRAALASIEVEERRRPAQSGRRSQRRWNAMVTFVPNHGLARSVRGTERAALMPPQPQGDGPSSSSPQPQQALVPFGQPVFLPPPPSFFEGWRSLPPSPGSDADDNVGM